MYRIYLCLAVLLCTLGALAQENLEIKVFNADTKMPLANANVVLSPLNRTTVTDTNGVAMFTALSPGRYEFGITHAGYIAHKGFVIIETGKPATTTVFVEADEEEEEEEEVVILSTRSSRTIRDIPTRVEFVAGEELDEKANMKPGDIRMVLNESTGITTQQTSATSANVSIRIQGLDGRYTQILRDGFPLYGGFSSGLGLLQTPPLDLKQFEVIKGSASTIYGGGSIAGLVNLISKTPGEKRELRFHFDATSAGGLNTSGFYGQKFKKTGITLVASRNSNKAFDPSTTGFTAIPKFERYTVNPKLFLY